MGNVLVENEEGGYESVSIVYKDAWYRLEGEEQNTYIELSESVDEENIDYKCVNHLQFESKRWEYIDFSRYPLKVLFGYTREVNGSMEHWFSYVFEGYTTATPCNDSDALIMLGEDTRHKDYVEPPDELIARAEEHGWLWCPDEEAFEDELYNNMDVEGYGGSVYLSDGVSIRRTTIPLKDMEKLLDKWDEIDLAESAKGK